MRGEEWGGGLREDARLLLRVSHERQVAGGGRVTHVDLGAGAGELGMDVGGDRLSVLLDYMGMMGWRATCSPATFPATSSAASPPANWRSSGRPDPGAHAGRGR